MELIDILNIMDLVDLLETFRLIATRRCLKCDKDRLIIALYLH